MAVDRNWEKLHAQVASILGNSVFSFQKDGENGELVVKTECLSLPVSELYNNSENVSVQGEGGIFCKFVGHPEKIISLLERVGQR